MQICCLILFVRFSLASHVLIKQLGMPPKLKEKVELWGEVKTNL